MLIALSWALLGCATVSPTPAAPPVVATSAPTFALSPEGIGPFQLGADGASVLAMEGAAQAEPDCPCAYNVRFEDAGVTVQVAEGVCGVWLDDPADAGLGDSTIADLAARYGEPWLEPATGDVRFKDAMWLAAYIGPSDSNTVSGEEPVRALLVGGCGE